MAAESPSLLFGVVFGGLFLFAGLGLVAASLRRLRKAVAVRRAGTATVADLAEGDLVTVSGTARALGDERAPAHFLTGVDDGLAVVTRIEKKTRQSGGGTGGTAGMGTTSTETWTTERTHFDAVPFSVADETGEIEVRPPELEAYPTQASFDDSVRLETQTVTDEPHVVGTAPREFDDYAFDGEAVADVDAPRRFEQGTLTAGDDARVMGRVHRAADGRLVVGAPENPDAFTLSAGDRGSASTGKQLVIGVAFGVLGAGCTVVGGGALAATFLPDLAGQLPGL